jgi:HAD superfamily hydrolase (TIGR01509 family)
MMRDVRAVLFDVEGVIAHRDVGAAQEALVGRWPDLSLEDVHQARNSGRLYPLWLTFSCGTLSSTSYWSAVLAELDVEVTDASVDDMRRIQEETAWARADEVVLGAVGKLREDAGVVVGVLSNSCVDYESHIRSFEEQFDVACFSHRTGLRKPNAAAFEDAAAKLGEPPESTLFFDDKPRNVLAASSLGFHAIQVIDTDSVTDELSKLGLLEDAR